MPTVIRHNKVDGGRRWVWLQTLDIGKYLANPVASNPRRGKIALVVKEMQTQPQFHTGAHPSEWFKLED